jgi:formylglycine-generating enzyme required for sulfatase activity
MKRSILFFLLLLICTGLCNAHDVKVVDIPGMVFVEGGPFKMGSNDGEANEKPVHEVYLSHFYIGKYEVTVGEFRAFVLATGYKTTAETSGGSLVFTPDFSDTKTDKDASWKNPSFLQTEQHPVCHLSLYDAIAYCNWRSLEESLNPCYSVDGKVSPGDLGKGPIGIDHKASGYRLPTEAEWEYAARGGVKRRGALYSGSNDIDSVAHYGWITKFTSPVGTKLPNELGIYDMTGNVREWTSDLYGEYEQWIFDPLGAEKGESVVTRGGSWDYITRGCTVTYRYNSKPDFSAMNLGFRIVRTAK